MRAEKQSMAEEVRGKLAEKAFVLLVDYQGLSVEQITDFRGRLRQKEALLQVVKNSMVRRAADDMNWDGFSELLKGPTAMIVGTGDLTEAAKVVQDFAREANLKVAKGGILGSRILSAEDVVQIAQTPPREVMLGRLVGTIAAPMTQLVGVMNQKVLSLLYVLKAVEEKKSQSK